MDAHLLETSLALVDTPDDRLTALFRALLLERHPWLRPLYVDDLGHRAKLLRSAVVSVVDHLDDPVWLAETLGGRGEAPCRRWNAGPTAYDAVTECLVAAMALTGGARWTSQMTDAWIEALDAVSGPMLLGYAPSLAS